MRSLCFYQKKMKHQMIISLYTRQNHDKIDTKIARILCTVNHLLDGLVNATDLQLDSWRFFS